MMIMMLGLPERVVIMVMMIINMILIMLLSLPERAVWPIPMFLVSINVSSTILQPTTPQIVGKHPSINNNFFLFFRYVSSHIVTTYLWLQTLFNPTNLISKENSYNFFLRMSSFPWICLDDLGGSRLENSNAYAILCVGVWVIQSIWGRGGGR